ncbi:MAG: hypothetical protein DA407_01185 [Bacteroidetes bacterium]|nr:MAG: hypothetical protein DA407_01185 [Bacteroidota bacterium]
MIKFFRHIRKNLLMENKTSKYFKYAIGEIILVVIGILIALQINNWNENRKNRIEETALLEQLRSEFHSNLKQLDQKISIRKDMIKSSQILLDYVDNPSIRNNDTISKYISFTTLAPTFDPIVNDLNGSGNIQLLSNNKLKKLLSFWTSELVQITEEEVAWITFRDNLYYPFLIEQNTIRNSLNGFWSNNVMDAFYLDEREIEQFSVGNSKRNVDLSKVLDMPAMESNLALCATFNKLNNLQSEVLRKRIVDILELIDNQLNEGK